MDRKRASCREVNKPDFTVSCRSTESAWFFDWHVLTISSPDIDIVSQLTNDVVGQCNSLPGGGSTIDANSLICSCRFRSWLCWNFRFTTHYRLKPKQHFRLQYAYIICLIGSSLWQIFSSIYALSGNHSACTIILGLIAGISTESLCRE